MVAEKWHIGNPVFESDEICVHHRVWPWNGHRLFAYDLVRFMKPDSIVELGTYWGTSYFSFCQAVKDQDLATEIIAVDTWTGDEHTGSYEENAFETVNKTVDTCFPDLNTRLLRMYFKQALEQIEDNTIDIMHIDGCHNYDAAQEDYTTWLPKLREGGVVLMHDIADSCDYGSVKFWNELRNQHPAFTFQHSWGLGVLFPKGDIVYQQMLENNFEDKLLFYENKSELNLMTILKDAHEERGDKQDALIKHQERVICEAKEKNDNLQSIIDSSKNTYLHRVLRKLRTFSNVGNMKI